jgi:hypothetical protein
MGNQTTQAIAATTNPLRIFWQNRSVKYTFPGGRYVVEEVKSPWDLYVEGQFFQSHLGDEFHILMVKHGMERIFSIRSDVGMPQCDIITKPANAPTLSLAYGARRVLHTGIPMEVDGEKLIVLEITATRGNRAPEPLLRLARDFYLAMGGRLTEEFPNGLIYSDRKDIKMWNKVGSADVLLDIMLSTKPIVEALPNLKPNLTIHIPNAELAIFMLGIRYWDRCFFQTDDPWTEEVLAHIEKVPEDMPYNMTVYGRPEAIERIKPRIQALYAKGNKK